MKGKMSFAVLLAVVLLLSVSVTAFAQIGPNTCSNGLVQWVCTTGDEDFNVLPEPRPSVSGHDGNGYFNSVIFSGAGLGGNFYVQRAPGVALRFKTSQEYVSWWDASGELNVVKTINGVATIPSAAVVAGIPGDNLGNFALAGWIKGQLASTGEYVLIRSSFAK